MSPYSLLLEQSLLANRKLNGLVQLGSLVLPLTSSQQLEPSLLLEQSLLANRKLNGLVQLGSLVQLEPAREKLHSETGMIHNL